MVAFLSTPTPVRLWKTDEENKLVNALLDSQPPRQPNLSPNSKPGLKPDPEPDYDPDRRLTPPPRDGRPYSRLNFEMTMMMLKTKREVPLLMSDMGCELSRFSMLQVGVGVGV